MAYKRDAAIISESESKKEICGCNQIENIEKNRDLLIKNTILLDK